MITRARYESSSGLRFHLNANGSIARIEHADITLNTYLGTELEGGPANLYLRRLDEEPIRFVPLLGPQSQSVVDVEGGRLVASGVWEGVEYRAELVLAASVSAWFWHVALKSSGTKPLRVDLVYAQDLALAHYGAIRNNEYYTSQYVDWTPLEHPARGVVLAARQNLSMGGRHPWAVLGTLGRAQSFATDALQVHGLAGRSNAPAPGLLCAELEGRRRQHEHAMAVLQHAPILLEPRRAVATGFFGRFEPHHESASSAVDLALVDDTLALSEARVVVPETLRRAGRPPVPSLFARRETLVAEDLSEDDLVALFGRERCEEERDGERLLSFFAGSARHVVLKAKEQLVLRPHGHILRTGNALVPDEAAMSSTVWMCGVFGSLVTQGHVNINRLIAATHGYLDLAKADGQRVFVETAAGFRLLDLPSAFEMTPSACRWIYKHEAGLIEVRSAAALDRHEIELALRVLEGPPVRFLVSTRVAIGGDDGATGAALLFERDRPGVCVRPPPDSEVGRRFPEGSFRIDVGPGTELAAVGGDELLYTDKKPRGEPFLVLVTAPAKAALLHIVGRLVAPTPCAKLSAIESAHDDAEYWQAAAGATALRAPRESILRQDVGRLAELLPWLAHNALVHYLAPHGLEQYSGGGWGTRDICQGPVEHLLALGEHAVLRDLLLRVFANQNSDGDWPQWFMFFERERGIRAPDSHGDVVFWPLLALAEYLVAAEDASILEVKLPFFDARGDAEAETKPLALHVERALALIAERVVADTRLAAYGNGDWNDSLQPADPSMKARLVSAWTVTLHFYMLRKLAEGLQAIGQQARAEPLRRAAGAVASDFRRLLLRDGVVAGLAYFHEDGKLDSLLHPGDSVTGISYSLLPMMHAMLYDLFTPEEAAAHRALIRAHLLAADGARLFDAPPRYQGGPQRHFQRAESASFFGREIGVMYMHAHLRYAETMAHVGDADAFFLALRQANPIALDAVVPSAARRQANCYYSSSDAAFADRYDASARYAEVKSGTVGFEGGWRIYSSGAGIALRLVHERFLGVERRRSAIVFDPVVPTALDGLEADVTLCGRRLTIRYRTGKAGRGPVTLRLDGRELPFERVPNPYRTGAAKVAVADLERPLATGARLLEITLE